MLKKMTVTQKASTSFAALSAICAVTGAATIFNVTNIQNVVHDVDDLRTVLDGLKDLEGELSGHMIMGDTFLLSSDMDAQLAFEEARVELAKSFDQTVTELSELDSELGTSAAEAREAWRAYAFDWMSEQFQLMGRVDGLDLARARESGGEGRRRFEKMKMSLGALDRDLAERMTAATDQEIKSLNQIFVMAVLGALITLAGSVGLGIAFHNILSRPLSRIRDVTTRLADGDLSVSIAEIERGDEIGDLSRALAVFQQNLSRTRKLEEEQAEAQLRAEKERKAMLQDVANGFETDVMSSIAGMSKAIGQLRTMALDVTGAARNTGEKAGAMTGATEASTQNISTAASAAEEMSATIQEIAQQIHKAAGTAQQGETASQEVTSQLEGLNSVVTNIESVVGLISDIAEQTNLLALNATIEAARAGDSGKGFAVVASEVKTLASQTAKATDDVARQIAQIRQSTDSVMSSSSTVANVTTQMSEISAAIAAAMEEQSATTLEIASNVERAAEMAGAVSKDITEVTDIANSTENASVRITDESSRLVQEAESVTERASNFVRRLREG